MRQKFLAFDRACETAAEAERTRLFFKAAQYWRTGYHLAPCKSDADWCFARADYCFKAAIDTGAIKVKKQE
ncbi:hypothetical protein HMPREF9952_0812 [Haemophilus pittmaniae HK 85]|uniref:ANR family transcriptional regulator n=1 Tax=Haemophilus pittmaniae HK 85 TaxID=1035188 RepID=F9Q9V9_9PAST|nr:ANR family transcriptional regulator [Haemophilus pittmaniae]EGV05760.1 hypothetical protein HMPREF9952_0812 [Haemophilus pittmaniae HK 85]